MSIEIEIEKAPGIKCERCWRVTFWNVPGVEICGRCRDVGVEDGWLLYDKDTATFYRNPDWFGHKTDAKL